MKNLHAATRRISLSFALVAGVPLGVVAVSPGASAAPGGSKLEPGQKLAVGQTLKSPNGAYKLYMQGDGNLVLYGPKGPLWSARTAGQGSYAVVQADGNFVVYDPGKKPLWNSGTWDEPGAELALQDDGNLVLYRQGKPVWSTNTYVRDTSLTPGEKLVGGATIVSGDDRYALLMQGDGNLVLYGPGGPRWAAGTHGAGNYAVMQKDGNLVVYDKQHHPRWATNTYGKPGARLYLQKDGNLVVYQGKTALWHSHTGEVPRELRAGETLHVGEQRFSPDGKHRLIFQGDGNLVLYGPGGAVRWASYTQGSGNYAVMQGDGNFVVYSAKGAAKWASNTAGQAGAFLKIGNDGVAALIRGGKTVWQSKAAEPGPPTGGVVYAHGPGNCSIAVDASLKDNLEALLKAAHGAGVPMCGWGWRSPAKQIELRKANCGSSHYAIWEKPASQCSPPTARPGQSMHERGLAIDFHTGNGQKFGGAQLQWMKTNAAKYGLKNLPSEPWHWSVNGN